MAVPNCSLVFVYSTVVLYRTSMAPTASADIANIALSIAESRIAKPLS